MNFVIGKVATVAFVSIHAPQRNIQMYGKHCQAMLKLFFSVSGLAITFVIIGCSYTTKLFKGNYRQGDSD